jgi:hypothetical protein
MKKNEIGQSTLEMLFVSVLTLSMVSGALSLLGLGLLKVRVEYLLHESLVCSMSEKHRNISMPVSSNICLEWIQQSIRQLPFQTKVMALQIRKRPEKISAKIAVLASLPIVNHKIHFRFTKSLALPFVETKPNL